MWLENPRDSMEVDPEIPPDFTAPKPHESWEGSRTPPFVHQCAFDFNLASARLKWGWFVGWFVGAAGHDEISPLHFEVPGGTNRCSTTIPCIPLIPPFQSAEGQNAAEEFGGISVQSPSISPENVSWFLSIPASLPSRIPTFAILASKAQSLALDLRWKIFQHHCPWLGYFYRSQTQQVDGKNGLFQLSCIHLSFLLATWCRREPSSRCSCHVRSARYNAPDAHSPLSIIPNAKNL